MYRRLIDSIHVPSSLTTARVNHYYWWIVPDQWPLVIRSSQSATTRQYDKAYQDKACGRQETTCKQQYGIKA